MTAVRGQGQQTIGLVSLPFLEGFLVFFALSVRTALAGVLSAANIPTVVSVSAAVACH